MTFVLITLYLGSGFVLFRRQFPDGVFPLEADPELERTRRTSRRRVLPRPRGRDL